VWKKTDPLHDVLRQNCNEDSFYCSHGKFAKLKRHFVELFRPPTTGFYGGKFYVLLGSHRVIIITYFIHRSDLLCHAHNYYKTDNIAYRDKAKGRVFLLLFNPFHQFSCPIAIDHYETAEM